jgi:hypothetical protein
MASWKKVIVSGSDAILNQLNVGTNQVITTTTPLTSTKITGSFTGSFIGDGTGITGITATGLNIPGTVTVITNEPFVVSGSAALQKITLADITSQITGSGLTKASGTGNTIMLNTSSAHFITGSRVLFTAGGSYLQYNNSTGLFTFDSGSYGTFLAGNGLTSTNGVLAVGAGDGISVTADAVSVNTSSAHFLSGVSKEVFDAANFVDSAYIDFTVTAGTSVTAVISSGSIQNGHLANSAVTIGTTAIPLGNSSTVITGLTSINSNNITGSAISASGTLVGGTITAANGITTLANNITAPNGYIRAGSPAGAPGTPGGIEGTYGFFNSLTSTGLVTLDSATVTNNLTVGGDLRVNGTASFINSNNLYVKDQFILLNSGSSALADTGIVAAYSASGVGSAFYLDAYAAGTYGRWGIAYNVSGTATTVTPDAYMVAASQSAGAPPATPTWGGASFGFGNIHINSGTGEIYIYS